MDLGIFDQPAEVMARQLVGATLCVDGVGGRIVETEAYSALDPASHSFRGPTPRNAPMFGPPGRAYVYRIYGLHWCFNIVCDARSPGSAVLIRALEPVAGLEEMQTRRRRRDPHHLCSGPAKLCQALAIDGTFNGLPLADSRFELQEAREAVSVVAGPRIGVSVGIDTPWRFAVAGSPFLSRRL